MSLIMDDYLACLSRGYGHSDKVICHDCVSDYALTAFIKENGKIQTCSYCKKRKKSILLEELMAPIMDGIRFMYSRAVDELPVDEGRFIGGTYTTDNILRSISNIIGPSYDEIIDDIITLIGEEIWCDANPFDESEDEVEFNQWQKFCTLVKEKMRYVFFEAKDDTTFDSSPIVILDFISACMNNIGLITKIDKTTKMYRCRMSKDEKYYSKITDFCPPPSQKTPAGRMNAQGIPVLYLALDPDTAVKEIDTPERQFASIATYRVEDSISVLDLTKLDTIKIPSIFDCEGRPKISTIRFLKRFNEQISQKPSIEQIDYVPTQIVTEYFRFLCRDKKFQYQGILYNSSKNKGGKCLVLFLSREEVINKKFGIHILPARTMYYSKKYEWTPEEEKARLLYVESIIEETGKMTLSEVAKEAGLSKTTTAQIIKKLQNKGILDKTIDSIQSPLTTVL